MQTTRELQENVQLCQNPVSTLHQLAPVFRHLLYVGHCVRQPANAILEFVTLGEGGKRGVGEKGVMGGGVWRGMGMDGRDTYLEGWKHT